jgi:hypothetical protein
VGSSAGSGSEREEAEGGRGFEGGVGLIVRGFFLGRNFLGSRQREAETQNKMYRERF